MSLSRATGTRTQWEHLHVVVPRIEYHSETSRQKQKAAEKRHIGVLHPRLRDRAYARYLYNLTTSREAIWQFTRALRDIALLAPGCLA